MFPANKHAYDDGGAYVCHFTADYEEDFEADDEADDNAKAKDTRAPSPSSDKEEQVKEKYVSDSDGHDGDGEQYKPSPYIITQMLPFWVFYLGEKYS